MSITGEALAGTFECYFTPHKTFLFIPIYVYRKPLDVYRYLRCGHGATLPTIRLTRQRDDFLHEGVGCLPVAQVTVASDANKVRL